jgi:hypothetical protein
MEKHSIPQLEARIKELEEACKLLGDNSDLVELLKVIHPPAWTTPAEFAFANAIVESLHGQAQTMLALRKMLLSASREVKVERTAAA